VKLLRPGEHPAAMSLIEAVRQVLSLPEPDQADTVISLDGGGPVMTLAEIHALRSRSDFPAL
jgi:hypothetical protein